MALFSDISQIREYIAVNFTSDFADIKPYIVQAETRFIRPLIGAALLDELTNFAEGSSTDADMAVLLAKVRMPLIYYAYYLFVPTASVQISSTGIHIAVTDSKKTAFEWQIDQLRDSWLNTAHDFTEELLTYLNDTEPDNWQKPASEDLFVRSADEFNQYYYINGSRRLYAALIPILKSVEQKYILPVLGNAFFEATKEALQASGELSADTLAIVDRIRPAIVHFTMARAISELSVEVLPNGLFENSVQVVSRAKQSVGAMKTSNLKSDLLTDARSELKALQEYLDANASATKYAEYFTSDKYVAPVTGVVRGDFVNTKTNGFFLA